jgi:hypothetical protein
MGSSSSTLLTIDSNHSDYNALCAQARRIDVLLRVPQLEVDGEVTAPLDLFLGAIHALIRARKLGFKDRQNRAPGVGPIQVLAAQLGAGAFRDDGDWLAGFHFNNGLVRLAAVYHRLLKITVGQRNSRDHRPVLVPLAEARYQQWTNGAWAHGNADGVYDEVNDIKHEPGGLHAGRDVVFSDAVNAADEILSLIEAWNAAGRP